ncbi:YbhB/YbcL family Raf kinase inhibitor-like protein [Mycobacterium sp. 050134]|uniref:YbhB/YbcL family Raf kinase inhibitor-like protein n=1 Tax=Mycobacterium sp. 050134 TaxID=3096111 RepID=UPI002ED8DEC4
MIAPLGRALRGVRAGVHRSPLSANGFDAGGSISVSSTAFTDGGPMPRSAAGKGAGDNVSPPLRWAGLPPGTGQVLLVIDDIDVPLPRPLLHTVALIEPTLDEIAAGALQPGSPGVRFVRADLGHRGYAGPRPIPGHGPHRYRFHVFAVDRPIVETPVTAKALFASVNGHVLARGTLTGTYER